MQISANGIAIEVDDRGLPSGEPVLLIMGLGMQLVAWPEELVQDLVSRGFRVVRFDNRDIGLSQGFDHLGVPNLMMAALRHTVRLPVASPYSLADMARDTIGVLDALGLKSAHIVGASMGGMIAQHLAAEYPERVLSLTLMMSSSGARGLPQPGWPVRRVMLSRPDGRSFDAVIAHYTRLFGVIGSPAYPPTPQRLKTRIEETTRRAYHPAGAARQLMAVVADGDRSPLLKRIKARTLVIHGEADPLLPVAAGRDLVAKIAGARGDFIPGMGHDLPLQLLPRFADAISAHARSY